MALLSVTGLAAGSRHGHWGRNRHVSVCTSRYQYDAWRAIAERAKRTTPEEVKKSHPKASILKGSRVVFSMKGNDYRLISAVDYRSGIVMVRFFGTHQQYDEVDAETV